MTDEEMIKSFNKRYHYLQESDLKPQSNVLDNAALHANKTFIEEQKVPLLLNLPWHNQANATNMPSKCSRNISPWPSVQLINLCLKFKTHWICSVHNVHTKYCPLTRYHKETSSLIKHHFSTWHEDNHMWDARAMYLIGSMGSKLLEFGPWLRILFRCQGSHYQFHQSTQTNNIYAPQTISSSIPNTL